MRLRALVLAVLAVLALVGPAGAAQAPTLMQSLQQHMGRAFSPEEKTRFQKAVQAQSMALKAHQAEFGARIARATGLKPAELLPLLPKVGDSSENIDKKLLPKLETALGHPLTVDQVTQIHAADEAKRVAMAVSREKFLEQLVKITNLKPEDVRPLMPKAGM